MILNNKNLPKVISGKNKTPFIVEGFTESSMKFDTLLTAVYDVNRSSLLNNRVFTAQCGVSVECQEYKDLFFKTKTADQSTKTGCCAGLFVDFIQPNFDLQSTYNSNDIRILFKNTTDVEFTTTLVFDIPNIYTVSYLNEIIINIIYDTNFENKNVEIYHPIIKNFINRESLLINLPKTNGDIINLDL